MVPAHVATIDDMLEPPSPPPLGSELPHAFRQPRSITRVSVREGRAERERQQQRHDLNRPIAQAWL